MLKILLATMSLGIGGAETHIVELALELKNRGYHVQVASNGGVYTAELENAGIHHFTVPMHRRRIFDMLKSYILMRKIIKREKPDIVHAHARIPGFICGLLQKTGRFSFVTTAHFDFEIGGGLRYLTNWGKKTVAVSEDIKNYLINSYNIKPDDIIVSVNGIDTGKFSPDILPEGVISEFNLDPSRPVICNVSRMDENAALASRMLVEIAHELHLRIPGIQILIVGDGNIFAELNEKAKNVNATTGTNTVTMTGRRTDVNAILAVCSLFVGVSRAALEALATSRPVILAGNEGCLGLFTPDKETAAAGSNFTCRGCGQTAPDVLLDEITRFFTAMPDDGKIALGAFGRDLILKNYSVSKMTDDCIRAYNEARKRVFNIVMSGYYGFKNAGDEAILQSICGNIKNACGGVAVKVLSSDPGDTEARYGYDAVARFNILRVIMALHRCDVLVSGGGSLLQDSTSTRSLLYYLFIIRAAKLMGKKVMLYANGIGPVRKKTNRRRVKRVIERVDVITLRDPESEDELRSMGVTRADIRVSADPVFALDVSSDAETIRLPGGQGLPNASYITVAIRDWPGTGGFCEALASVCDSISRSTGRSTVFVPMQADKDTDINRIVQGLMETDSYVLEGRLTAEELMGVIGRSDFMLAMRLHAMIFAARMNVPFASIVYDPKVLAYSHALGMPDAGDVTDFDRERALGTALKLLESREAYIKTLKDRSEGLREAAKHDPELLMELLNK